MPTRLILHAGEHSRVHCPVSARLQPGSVSSSRLAAVDEESGQESACQVRFHQDHWVASWIVPELCAGEVRQIVLREASSALECKGVELVETDGGIDVALEGLAFTSLHTASTWARPFLHPVIGPYGHPVTRAYPVVEGVQGETQDHPHHKSIWVAWGDVNGTDNWSESRERGHGTQRIRGPVSCVSGPVFGHMSLALDWFSEKKRTVLAEEREVTIWNLPAEGRLIDLSVTFRATNGPVRFGDTKEGGICSLRVASSMDASGDGTIRNAFGGINEKETWGKRAQWCDYVGPVEDDIVGIAIFDHPGNLRHPTYWHVRNYGLMTANPFGISHFSGDRTRDGSWRLQEGSALTFRYRIYIHAEDTLAADVAGKYHDFINPPAVKET